MENKIRCEKVNIDYIINDVCNGKISFDVKKDIVNEMIKFIIVTLNKFGIPFVGIYSSGEFDLDESQVMTKERIAEFISNNADYLKNKVGEKRYGKR